MNLSKRQKSQRSKTRAKAKQSTQPAQREALRQLERQNRHDRTLRRSSSNCDTAALETLPSSQPAPAVVESEKSLPTTASRGSSAGATEAASPDDRLAANRGKVERAFTWLEAKVVVAEWCRRHLREL